MVYIEQKQWLAIEIDVVPEAAEAVEFAFNELGSIGTEINNLGKKSGENVCVVGYFESEPDEEAIQDELYYALRIYGFSQEAIVSASRHEVQNTDWMAEWKKHWKPTEVGRFVIAPPWEDVDSDEKIVIRIEPNMAFGTGTHETTQLCLKAIEENYRPGQTFLDVGTGTGILAIAAAVKSQVPGPKSQVGNLPGFATWDLGPGTWDLISACDTDEASITFARENAKLNGIDDIEFFVGSITDDTPEFDFVCANLTVDVIVPLLPLLIRKTRKTLVLSGILREQEEMIVSALVASSVKDFAIERSGEWIAVTIYRSEPPA